jgi:magnesium chelatase family protein
MAHNGVLFLDELPEFKRDVLEVMRQPLEDREVTIKSEIYGHLSFVIHVSSQYEPSPSGFNDPDSPQTSSPHEMQRYLSKISGPLLDRIDIHIEVTPVPFEKNIRRPKGRKQRRHKKKSDCSANYNPHVLSKWKTFITMRK